MTQPAPDARVVRLIAGLGQPRWCLRQLCLPSNIPYCVTSSSYSCQSLLTALLLLPFDHHPFKHIFPSRPSTQLLCRRRVQAAGQGGICPGSRTAPHISHQQQREQRGTVAAAAGVSSTGVEASV
jgi:hypothetical protein